MTARRCLFALALAVGLAAGAARAQGDSDTSDGGVGGVLVQPVSPGGREDLWRGHVVQTPEGDRTAATYAPDGAVSEGQRPALVIVLHGNGGSGMTVAEATGFHDLAAREGFVVAFPNALGGSWNYVRGLPGYPEAPDDVAFLTDLARDLEARYGTDPHRRYVAGYSNGGFMAQRLACDAPGAFAAFVSVSAGGFAGLDAICPEGAAGSIALMHGTADANVPWGGLPVEVPGGVVHVTWPIPTTFAWWAERAGCTLPAIRTELAGNPSAGIDDVVVFSLEDCSNDRVIALYGLRGGGHGWPTGDHFDATRAAWAFLRAQSGP